ncbi:hypothetical protein OIU34_20555 [Pararhizobium sp. BT-229]|uniref:hypothetical protein n=1 Tax=Pararhizobium sp. BT-229 TaxID=2986923 RepID=UPI0021F797B2|nr:hypothetical protein [Pararhizobium sp. BT-229]MCV9964281.1 hypothetical protein [Pararhizobium sp. BT-229]
MPDSNPKLTMQLHNAREALLVERTDIFRRVQALQAELDMNSTKIEATDTVMLLFNPEHVALDVRSDADAAPMVVVGRRTLQLASSVADAAVSQPPAEAEQKGSAKPKDASKGKRNILNKKLSVKEQIAAVDAALGAKSERDPASQAISDYFRKSGRNDTILKILESKDGPVNAATVAKDYKALYPLPEDSAAMRTLHTSRIASALHYLKDRGQAIRIADERPDGKGAENVRWELSKSYRSELRKTTRTVGRSKSNGHSALGAEPTGGEVRIAVGAH